MKNHALALSRLLPAESEGLCVDAALITSAPNRFYLTGFKSSAGYVLVTREEAYFLIDFRYAEAARAQVRDLKVHFFTKLGTALRELIEEHGLRGILLENAGISLSDAARLEYIFHEAGAHAVKNGVLDTLLVSLRRVKSAEEIEKIRQAQRITEYAFGRILGKIRPGVTERELALELEFDMRRQGADSVAFDLIVVSGVKSSMPHGEPGKKPLEKGDFVTLDIGACLSGYHSDMTRTVALGSVSEEQRAVYDTVLKAQLAGLEAVCPGALCAEVDSTVRSLIDGAGYTGCFGHSTGHGVGLEIHEAPYLVSGSQTVLAPGMVVTVEPGIYLEGRFGVRIEDMVAVTKDGAENLTKVSKELLIL